MITHTIYVPTTKMNGEIEIMISLRKKVVIEPSVVWLALELMKQSKEKTSEVDFVTIC